MWNICLTKRKQTIENLNDVDGKTVDENLMSPKSFQTCYSRIADRLLFAIFEGDVEMIHFASHFVLILNGVDFQRIDNFKCSQFYFQFAESDNIRC